MRLLPLPYIKNGFRDRFSTELSRGDYEKLSGDRVGEYPSPFAYVYGMREIFKDYFLLPQYFINAILGNA